MFSGTIPRFQEKNIWFLLAICLGQLCVIVVPFILGAWIPVVVVVALISMVALFGSPTLALLYLSWISIILTTQFSDDYLRLPLHFTFYEGLFMMIATLVFLSWMQMGNLSWGRSTRLDRPVMVFLLAVGFSVVLGLFYGQSTSQMLRDVRFPLYYALFFVVSGFFDVRKSFTFLLLILGGAAVVGVEYLVELVQTVNLSFEGAFYRVARIEGLMMPIGTLLIATIFIYDTSFFRQFLSGLALAPVGVALMVTVGRGMWIATLTGLLCLIGLVYIRRHQDPKPMKRVLILVLIPFFVLMMGYVFQRITGIGVGETATRRLVRAVDHYEQDHSISGRLQSYGAVLEKVIQRPLLGGGHGETVTYVANDEDGVLTVMTLGAVDSTYLTILMRMGIVGLIAFLWMYVRSIRMAYGLLGRTNQSRVRLFCAAFVAVYSAMLVYGIADATLIGNRLIFIHVTFMGILARLDIEEADGASA